MVCFKSKRNDVSLEIKMCFYGIDFEGEEAEDTAQAAGMLLGFLGMTDPADTPLKQKVCSALRDELCRILKLSPEILDRKTEEARAMLRHKRKQRMNGERLGEQNADTRGI